jgi:hypothetical protein
VRSVLPESTVDAEASDVCESWENLLDVDCSSEGRFGFDGVGVLG